MTSRFIYGEDERLIAWARERLKVEFRDDARTIGRETDGNIRGVAIFDTFSDTSCLVHLVSDGTRRWITRDFIVRVFAYPFLQCRYPRITCFISAENADSLRLTRHFGWVEEGRLRAAEPNGADRIVFGMLRHECRYLPPPNPFAGNVGPGAV